MLNFLDALSKRGELLPLIELRRLEREYAPDDEGLLTRLYTQLRVGGAVYKTTKRNRMPDLDERLRDTLLERYPDVNPIQLHDVGASSGITTLELWRCLSQKLPMRVHGSDRFDRLDFVTLASNGWTVVFDNDGSAVQALGRKAVICPVTGDQSRHPVHRILHGRVIRDLVPAARAVLERASFDGGASIWEGEGGKVKRLRLVHPEVAREILEHEGFTFGCHDVFQHTTPYMAIRAVNVLNLQYFKPEQLKAAVTAIHQSLHSGGMFLVGRTIDEDDARNSATLYERTDAGFREIWKHHEGTEISDHIPSA